MDSEHRWPEDFPEECPPAEADGPEDLTVYRFVKHDPPAPADFLRPIDKPRKQEPEPDELCALHALSVFTDPDDIPVVRAFIPGFKKKLVAEGTIDQNDGVVVQEPSEVGGSPPMESHHDWWVPEDVDPGRSFQVVEL